MILNIEYYQDNLVIKEKSKSGISRKETYVAFSKFNQVWNANK